MKLECLDTTNLEDSNSRILSTRDKAQSSKFPESSLDSDSDHGVAAITVRDHGAEFRKMRSKFSILSMSGARAIVKQGCWTWTGNS